VATDWLVAGQGKLVGLELEILHSTPRPYFERPHDNFVKLNAMNGSSDMDGNEVGLALRSGRLRNEKEICFREVSAVTAFQ
jgi:hypothetical protein